MNTANIQPAVYELQKKLVERFNENVKLYIYGSVARGEYNSESDIDVLVLLPIDLTHSLEEEIFDIAYDVELEYDVVFGITAYSTDFWISHQAHSMPLFKNIQKEGKAV